METDVAILGGGAAGLAAARETIRRGGGAVLVNRGPLGGDCTFTGCVPSKAVIEAAKAGYEFRQAFDRARSAIERIAATETAARLQREGVTVIDDEGELTTGGPGGRGGVGIAVGGRTITAKGVVLALGSKPAIPPIPGLDGIDYLTTENLWELTDPPRSMVIVGAGAIGCELAQALTTLGVEVTLVEMANRVLIREEPAASAVAAGALRASGVKLLTGATVTGVGRGGGGGVVVELGDGQSIEAERVLVAVGRRPNSDRGGLVEAGIELGAGGHVENDDDLSTSVGKVYVAGDLAGRLQFTHAADHMGRLAAGNILNKLGRVGLMVGRFKEEQIPWVTFTHPEIARIGLSEAEAAREIKGAMVAELPMTEHDRAITADATTGFIKLIAGPKTGIGMLGGGRIIGATIVADRAGEMISELALAVRLGAFTGRLAQTVHPYPTWSYGLVKAAAQFFMEVEGRSARPAREETEHAEG